MWLQKSAYAVITNYFAEYSAKVPWMCRGNGNGHSPTSVGVHMYHLSRAQRTICFNSVNGLKAAKRGGPEGGPLTSVDPSSCVFGTLRTTVFSAVHYPGRNLSRDQYAGDPTASFTVEESVNKVCILARACRRLESQD